METIAGLPFVELTLDRHGRRERTDVPVVPEGVTDLIVLSHGWKNSRGDALALYRGILEGVRAASDDSMADEGRVFAAVGVLWPAFQFQPDLSLVRDEIETADPDRGGARSVMGTGPDDEAISGLAEEVADRLGIDPRELAEAAISAAAGGGAADAFLAKLRSSFTAGAPADVRAEHRELRLAPGGELVASLAAGGELRTEEPTSGRRGSAAGLREVVAARGWRLVGGGRAAVATILNQATYFEMKNRAGVVGAALAELLDGAVPEGVRVHLVGHSFGGRLVTGACAAMRTLRPASMSLLQAAFSHNGLGTGVGPRSIDGAFRSIVTERRVEGPILVTHTRRDTAVGFFYAVASSASGEIAKGAEFVQRLVGGPDDLHGGMGANGAQAMLADEIVRFEATPGTAPELVDGKVNNVLADEVVTGHNDVANAEVARLIWRAMR